MMTCASEYPPHEKAHVNTGPDGHLPRSRCPPAHLRLTTDTNGQADGMGVNVGDARWGQCLHVQVVVQA